MFLPLFFDEVGAAGGGALPIVDFPLRAQAGGGGAHNERIVIAAGDAFTLSFPILRMDGGVPAYVSPSAILKLFPASYAAPGATAILTKSTAGPYASIAHLSGQWKLVVIFLTADTIAEPRGDYYYQAEVTDGVNEHVVADGVIHIDPNLVG